MTLFQTIEAILSPIFGPHDAAGFIFHCKSALPSDRGAITANQQRAYRRLLVTTVESVRIKGFETFQHETRLSWWFGLFGLFGSFPRLAPVMTGPDKVGGFVNWVMVFRFYHGLSVLISLVWIILFLFLLFYFILI